MIFTEQEQIEIKKLSDKNDLVKRLWEDYQNPDAAKIYYTALTDAIVEISKQIKDKTIDVEDAYTKSILKLAETGDKVFNTLERGKQELTKGLEMLNEEATSKKGKALKLHEGKALI